MFDLRRKMIVPFKVFAFGRVEKVAQIGGNAEICDRR